MSDDTFINMKSINFNFIDFIIPLNTVVWLTLSLSVHLIEYTYWTYSVCSPCIIDFNSSSTDLKVKSSVFRRMLACANSFLSERLILLNSFIRLLSKKKNFNFVYPNVKPKLCHGFRLDFHRLNVIKNILFTRFSTHTEYDGIEFFSPVLFFF